MPRLSVLLGRRGTVLYHFRIDAGRSPTGVEYECAGRGSLKWRGNKPGGTERLSRGKEEVDADVHGDEKTQHFIRVHLNNKKGSRSM
jgi:hypothetical protein